VARGAASSPDIYFYSYPCEDWRIFLDIFRAYLSDAVKLDEIFFTARFARATEFAEGIYIGNKPKKIRAKIKINQPARQVLAADYFFLLFLPYLAWPSFM
jgi:hypothetical protein